MLRVWTIGAVFASILLVAAGPAPTPAPDNASLNERLQRLELSQEAEVTTLAREDLGAQKSMADSARAMIQLTIVQLVVGIFSVAGLVVTLVLTQRTINASAFVSRAQLQPYLAFSDFKSVDDNSDSLSTEYRWALKNFGGTPARNVRSRVSFTSVKGRPESHEAMPAPIESLTPLIDIAPGATTSVIFIPSMVGVVNYYNMLDRTNSLIMAAIVTYEDIFGQTHEFYYSDIRTGRALLEARQNTAFQKKMLD